MEGTPPDQDIPGRRQAQMRLKLNARCIRDQALQKWRRAAAAAGRHTALMVSSRTVFHRKELQQLKLKPPGGEKDQGWSWGGG